MDTGWVKIHRKLLENPIAQKAGYFALWVTLLLKANHKQNSMIWNNDLLVIKEGQLLTGRESLAKETGLSPSTVENILNFLEKQGQIEQQKTTKFRLITIVNWKNYQVLDNKVTTKRQQGIQQDDTNKNDKNVKNDKNNISEASSPEDSKQINQVIDAFTKINGEAKNFFRNKTQREASLYLVQKYTFEKVKKAIRVIDFNFSDSFCPKAISPHELKIKWAKIAMYHTGKCRKTPEYEKEFEKYFIAEEKKNINPNATVKKIKTFIGGAEVNYEFYEE